MACLRSGCQNEVPPGKELCSDCWADLSRDTKDDYYRAKRNGDLERWRQTAREELE